MLLAFRFSTKKAYSTETPGVLSLRLPFGPGMPSRIETSSGPAAAIAFKIVFVSVFPND